MSCTPKQKQLITHCIDEQRDQCLPLWEKGSMYAILDIHIGGSDKKQTSMCVQQKHCYPWRVLKKHISYAHINIYVYMYVLMYL